MWSCLYNFVALPVLFFFIHVLSWWPARSGTLLKIRNGVRDRKDWLSDLRAQLQPFSTTPLRVWIHAASMGECEQAQALLREIGARFPQAVRVLTIFSPSAMRHLTRSNFPAEVICYLPFDSWPQVRKFYDTVQPRVGIVIRHDYWPNFMWQAKRRGMPLLLANASVSANANSFRHKPLVRHFNREVLAQFDVSPRCLLPLRKTCGRCCVIPSVCAFSVTRVSSKSYIACNTPRRKIFCRKLGAKKSFTSSRAAPGPRTRLCSFPHSPRCSNGFHICA